jgi:hypothetical protein
MLLSEQQNTDSEAEDHAETLASLRPLSAMPLQGKGIGSTRYSLEELVRQNMLGFSQETHSRSPGKSGA